jgi:phosphomannomutase
VVTLNQEELNDTVRETADEDLRLERLKSWLSSGGGPFGLQMGPMSVELLRALTEAETPAAWDPAVSLAHSFLSTAELGLTEGVMLRSAESAKLFSILLTILVEAGQYRHELAALSRERRDDSEPSEPLPEMAELREHTITAAKTYLRQPVFSSLTADLGKEIFPLLESMGDTSGKKSQLARGRYMPFRVIQAGNIVERLYSLRLRTAEPALAWEGDGPSLLRQIYDYKYVRFGTSGVRGRWGLDFTEERAKRVVQAICDFLKAWNVPGYVGAEDLRGKRIVIGHDSRRNSRLVAEWVAQVCLANGFKVDLANRDTPTPALVYYLTDFLDPGESAGLINCTASHNPPEWQGIKFNPRQGYPAPTNLTDFIASRANQLNLLGESSAVANLAAATQRGEMRGFDPIVNYCNWIFDSGKGNQRISIDRDRIRAHFNSKQVIVDEMHGASRGYLTRILGEIGVRHTVIHAECDPNIPGLDYANPEEPFINTLKEEVARTEDAILGVGMDTDADRFGAVDRGGIYFRPNQLLPMLVRYLGIDRGLKGRVIATQTGSPLLEALAAKIEGNEQCQPEAGVVPPYVDHPFYIRRIGKREDRVYRSTFMVAVGIKYIEEQRRTDRHYKSLKTLPNAWRDTLLLGGEESSGLTTRGHVTDKDGIWANLLIMDMVAFYGKSLAEIWGETTALAGWNPSGGGELEQPPSNSGRTDVDAVLEAKEELINDYLDRYQPGGGELCGLEVIYAGGIRYDFVELQLSDPEGGDQHYLRVRASGTEPINRIYVESGDPEIARRLMKTALQDLEGFSITEIRNAHSEWRLAEILASTRLSPKLITAVVDVIEANPSWSRGSLIEKLQKILPTVERRNQEVTRSWLEALGLAF